MNKFADDTELGGADDTAEDDFQRDSGKLERWAIKNQMKFIESKCWILHLVRGNPGCTYTGG